MSTRPTEVFRIDTHIEPCLILRRVNRFSAEVALKGSRTLAHINNTGRLQELLMRGNGALCYEISGQRYKFRLYAVEEKMGSGAYALIDTYLQERCFERAIRQGMISLLGRCVKVKRRPRVGDRTYDFLAECERGVFLVEIKSATLRVESVYASYPDTRSNRGIRHIIHLPMDAKLLNAKPLLYFIAGIRGVVGIIPNATSEPRIAEALRESVRRGLLVGGASLFIDGRDPGSILLENPSLPVLTWENK